MARAYAVLLILTFALKMSSFDGAPTLQGYRAGRDNVIERYFLSWTVVYRGFLALIGLLI